MRLGVAPCAELQEAFAQAVRTGDQNVPGALLYHRRMIQGIDRALRKAFPIAVETLGAQWDQLVRNFVAEHTIRAPQVWKVGLELVTYVKESGYGKRLDRPYLDDLLWFEWAEIAVRMAPDRVGEGLHLNPAHDLSHFKYRVFKPGELDMEGDFFLLTFRHRETFQVRFIELSPLYALALQQLPCNPEEAFCNLGLPLAEDLCQKGIECFKHLRTIGALMGEML